MTLVIELPEEFINEKDPEEVSWIYNDILDKPEKVTLWSNEIGDALGEVTELHLLEVR